MIYAGKFVKRIGVSKSSKFPSNFFQLRGNSTQDQPKASGGGGFRVLPFLFQVSVISASALAGAAIYTFESDDLRRELMTKYPEYKPAIEEYHQEYRKLKLVLREKLGLGESGLGKTVVVTPVEKVQKQPEKPKLPLKEFKSHAEVTAFLNELLGRLLEISKEDKYEKSSTEVRAILEYMQGHVAQFKKHFEAKEKDYVAKLSASSKDFKEKIEKETASLIAQAEKDTEAKLKEKFDAERTLMMENFENKLKETLSEKESQLKAEYEKAKEQYESEVRKRLQREAKIAIDKERAGRLAKLDTLALQLKKLQIASDLRGDYLNAFKQINDLWSAYYKLEGILSQSESRPLSEGWNLMAAKGKGHKLVKAALVSVDPKIVEKGVKPLEQLQFSFHPLRESIRSVALVPEDGGLLAIALSKVLSYFTFRKHGLVDGHDVESILSRAEYYLCVEQDVLNAAKELNQLKGWSKKIASDWLKDARDYLEVHQAVSVIHTHLALLSLNVLPLA